MTEPRKPLSDGQKSLLFFGVFAALIIIFSIMVSSPKEKEISVAPASSKSQVKGASTPEVKFVDAVVTIPYQTLTEEDASLLKGQTSVTPGVNGQKTVTYKVTTSDGVETARDQYSEVVTKQPINQVTHIGTKVVAQVKSSSCNPNYSGCVPNASDVDCAGGSGNGPAYTGRTTVTGYDVYDLDRDGDGVACE